MNPVNPVAFLPEERVNSRFVICATPDRTPPVRQCALPFVATIFLLAIPMAAVQPALAETSSPSFQTPQASIQAPSPSVVVASTDQTVGATASTPSVKVTPVGSASATAPIAPPPFEVYTDYNWGNAMAKKLRRAPAKLFNFDRASLRDVLRFLADDAGIPFVAMQESTRAENTLVTFTLRASPFLALETIARANGVALFYDNGIWFMRPLNENELIARVYKLKYNPQDMVKYTGAQNSSSSNTSSENSDITSMNLTLQEPTDVFKVEAPATVEEIRKLLGIPTSGFNAPFAGETSVDNMSQLDIPPSLNPSSGTLNEGKGDGGAQVIYNSDANSLYIVATRQQHQWVEGFLSAVDKPQALIGIEIKFLETNKDPKSELGINWSETLEGGYGVTAAGSAFVEGGMDTSVITSSLDSFGRLNGTTVDANGNRVSQAGELRSRYSNVSQFDVEGLADGPTANSIFGDPGSTQRNTFSSGYSAVLAPDDVTVRLEAFLRDKDTSVVQYPRMLTVNNREVALRSVINTPVLGSASSVNSGANIGTNTSEVVYLPIGTIINVLPKTMPDGSVIMNVAITISRIVTEIPITIQPGQTQLYPVPASRVYNASLHVDSGYTLAVSGLDEANDVKDDTGVPYLKDIPGLGQLFKSKARSQNKKNLIIFITPTVFNDRRQTEGISSTPDSIVPKRPDAPSPPAFSATGRLVGGYAAIDEALAWLEFQIRIFKQMRDENMTDAKTQGQLDGVIASTEMLIKEIQLQEEESPQNLNALIEKEQSALLFLGELKDVFVTTDKKEREFSQF